MTPTIDPRPTMFPHAAKSHWYVLSLLIAAVSLLPLSAAHADTLTVNTTEDAGAGSLRQAILDANATVGADDIVFAIPTTDVRYNGQWWTIVLAEALPVVEDSGTRILGFSQTTNVGDTNPGVVGTGGTVGVDQMALPQFARPEIQIDAGGFDGLTIGASASDVLIEGVAVVNAENGIVAPGLQVAATQGLNRTVKSVFVGAFADGNDPAALRNRGHGIVVESPAAGLPVNSLTVTESYVGYNGQVGILGMLGATTLTVTSNEVFANGQLSDAHDGIDINGVEGMVVGNLSRDNTKLTPTPTSSAGHGIEAGSSNPGDGFNSIENNTVMNNLGAGIAIRAGSSGNTVLKNIATGNEVGVYVNQEQSGRTDQNYITQNSTYGNNGLGIDLHAGQSGVAFDGVTLNSPSSGQGGSNLLVAFPVIEEAFVRVDTLTVIGFADPGATIEFFEANADPTGFGEGQTFIFSAIEGSVDDADGTTGSYGPVVNQVVVSTEELTTNRFEFRAIVSGVEDSVLITAAQIVPAPAGVAGKLAGANTSEFGPVVTAPQRGGVANEVREIPGSFKLLGAYPNPFNPSTTIAFELERPGAAEIRVFNALGAEIASLGGEQLSVGSHRVSWNAGSNPSGVYFYHVTVDGQTLTGKVTLLK